MVQQSLSRREEKHTGGGDYHHHQRKLGGFDSHKKQPEFIPIVKLQLWSFSYAFLVFSFTSNMKSQMINLIECQVVLKAINSDLVTAEEFWREHQSSAQVNKLRYYDMMT